MTQTSLLYLKSTLCDTQNQELSHSVGTGLAKFFSSSLENTEWQLSPPSPLRHEKEAKRPSPSVHQLLPTPQLCSACGVDLCGLLPAISATNADSSLVNSRYAFRSKYIAHPHPSKVEHWSNSWKVMRHKQKCGVILPLGLMQVGKRQIEVLQLSAQLGI